MAGSRPRVVTLICAMILALIAGLVRPAAAFADPPKPLITTPTPQPTPTPTPMLPQQRIALTPEALRTGGLVFLPFVVHAAGRGAFDAPPGSFEYLVKPGDTLWSLSLDFGRDLDTMACATAPTGDDAERLVPGQTIVVPALTDLCYTVTPDDTLAGIAAKHGLSVEAIVAVTWNGFTAPPYTVRPRQRVLLPGARPDAAPRADRRRVSVAEDAWAFTDYRYWPFGDGAFVWPVIGPISQGAHAGHMALDIAVPIGTLVRAADRGTVVTAGWSTVGYGFRVVIDHGNDYVTLYGHLSDIYVEPGQVVGKGQVIGASGANGNITGPHLHFELRDFGRLIDPLPLLP